MAGRPTNAERRATEVRRALGNEIATIRRDAGISGTRLAAAARISRSHLWGVEAGRREATTEILVRVADALGANLSIRVHPGTGPRIRDHIQAAIAEALLRDLAPRWKRFPEVPVYRPVRGVIDVVLQDPVARLVVAGEIQSELRRLEQVVRWSHQKRDALPSASFWTFAGTVDEPTTSGLLVLRSSRANRQAVDDHAAQLGSAFPARTRDAVASLTGTVPWPGSAIVWATVVNGRAEILEGPPRSVAFGR
jgi:transcriptional regulator with XRE-family HTH domain